MSDSTKENAGIAFALVIGAGASTGLGAAVVFLPSLVKLASRRVLASSLGFSAGVMTYVSFVEIFQKSLLSFIDAGHEDNKAYSYATLCFFSGVLVMMILNAIVNGILGEGGHKHHHSHFGDDNSSNAAEKVAFTPPCCGNNPVEMLETTLQMTDDFQHQNERPDKENKEKDGLDLNPVDNSVETPPLEKGANDEDPSDNGTVEESEDQPADEENKRLVKMGLNTAIAIALHNFPEGLATFVAALNDPAVGAVLAVAIAIHNIPEGLCVALPIFYATGKRFNAFMWALLSGASEIVAALLGYAILANRFSDTTYAVLFGIVGGMMVIISVRELLPTAHFYDPEDTVVTYSFIAGMMLMALSLVLFAL